MGMGVLDVVVYALGAAAFGTLVVCFIAVIVKLIIGAFSVFKWVQQNHHVLTDISYYVREAYDKMARIESRINRIDTRIEDLTKQKDQ